MTPAWILKGKNYNRRPFYRRRKWQKWITARWYLIYLMCCFLFWNKCSLHPASGSFRYPWSRISPALPAHAATSLVRKELNERIGWLPCSGCVSWEMEPILHLHASHWKHLLNKAKNRSIELEYHNYRSSCSLLHGRLFFYITHISKENKLFPLTCFFCIQSVSWIGVSL